MRVRLARLRSCRVLVLMVFIVNVPMGMHDSLMDVLMGMVLRKMEPYSKGHQNAGTKKGKAKRFF